MAPHYKLQHIAEYALARLACALFDRISLVTADRIAERGADLFFRLHALRRRIAVDNLLKSGVARDMTEAVRIARASFRHFAVLLTETLKSGEYFTEQNWRERIRLDIHPDTMALLEKPGQGLMLVSGHFGNWEIAAQMVSYIKPVVGIARRMDNPLTDRLMKEHLPRNRFSLTPKNDADPRRLLDILKRGEVLAILADQHARQKDMILPFFGRPAYTHTSPARLHLITRTPLAFGYCLRTGPMQYILHFDAPIIHPRTGNREADVRAILEKLTASLEHVVRQYPEQYLWAHRRWKVKQPWPPQSLPADAATTSEAK